MGVNVNRIKKDMEYINSLNATPQDGYTRFSYSNEDKKARDYLKLIMKDFGLEISIDGVGNIRGKLCTNKNRDIPSVMIGSHIDTVLNGGRFDGLTGVIVGLEVIRTIKESNISINKPIELVIFAEEEGSNFDLTLLGSKCITGNCSIDKLKKASNEDGLSAYDTIKEAGYNVDKIPEQTMKIGQIDSMIELHVEQGGILDNRKIPIGIVEAIAGMNTLRINVKGISNHAGSTPMNLRTDSLVASSELIIFIKDVASRKAFSTTVATVGKIHAFPNKSNVITKEVDFYVDIRDVKEEGIEVINNLIKEKAKLIESTYGVTIEISKIGESDVVKLSPRIIDTIEAVAKSEGVNYIKMNSGAVHDSVMLVGLTDVGMIFIPSIGGYSHCKEEDTAFEDIKKGGDLLLETVISLVSK